MSASLHSGCCVRLVRCHEATLLFVAGPLGVGSDLRLLLRQHLQHFSNSRFASFASSILEFVDNHFTGFQASRSACRSCWLGHSLRRMARVGILRSVWSLSTGHAFPFNSCLGHRDCSRYEEKSSTQNGGVGRRDLVVCPGSWGFITRGFGGTYMLTKEKVIGS